MRVTTIRTILADECRGINAWKHAANIPNVRQALVDALGDNGDEVVAVALGEEDPTDAAPCPDEAWDQCCEAFDGSGLTVTNDNGRAGQARWDEGAIVWECQEESDLEVCSCCAQLIANGSTEGGHSEEEEKESRDAIAQHCARSRARLVIMSDCGDESSQEEFSRVDCDLCGGLPGARYAVASLTI